MQYQNINTKLKYNDIIKSFMLIINSNIIK